MNMPAIFPLDHRLALVALTALLLAAAAPLAYAWAGLLPEEPPPFETAPATAPQKEAPSNGEARREGDPLAVFLLICVTLSYILRFPGLPLSAALPRISALMPQDYFNWLVLGGRAFFVVVPGLAAAYSAARPNPIRMALMVGGLLVLALWLVSPVLRAAIAAG
jgi:hypothetical protein